MKKSTTLEFRAIKDRFSRLEEVQNALRTNGLESSQLIVGIDFTKVRILYCLEVAGIDSVVLWHSPRQPMCKYCQSIRLLSSDLTRTERKAGEG